MSEIKYEPLFGPQELFDGAPSDSTHATKGGGFYMATEDGGVQYLSRGPLNGDRCKYIDGYLIAERRIIAEPKRWTLEDKKAGMLPDVGCKVINTDHSISLYVLCKVIYVDDKVVIVYNGELSQTYSHKAFLVAFNPIETPEEKAQREEDGFVASVIDLASENQLMSCGFKDGVIAAYRKLKGGE